MLKSVLKTIQLSKVFTDQKPPVTAIHDVSLDIKKGASVAIIGASGSGKSTLLHMLGLLEAPSSGDIQFEGTKTSKLGESQKASIRNQKIGFVFQDFNLLPHLTIIENVMLPFLFSKKENKQAKKLALEAINKVGLSHRTDFLTKVLSGGEKQRAAIARAIVLKPDIILADEPTGNLDSHTGDAIIKLLFNLQKNEGITLVIVTHDMQLAKKANSIIEIQDGRIISQ